MSWSSGGFAFPALYDPLYEKPAPLVPRHLRFEVAERLDHTGAVVTPLDVDDVERAAAEIRRHGVEAVAVCLLHSYANPAHEQQVGEILRRELPDRFISLSVDVLPQKREYERTSTTVINAYVGPPVQRYVQSMLDQLAASGVAGRLMVMQSSGGILDAASVLAKPALITECGPAAGVVAAEHVARLAGYDNVITLDMGGTTAKASIIERGADDPRRRVRGRRRHVGAKRARGRWRLRPEAAGDRHLGGRRGRWQHRLARQGGVPEGRPGERRRGAGPGVLRRRQPAADGHRCQRRARLSQSRGARRRHGADPGGSGPPGGRGAHRETLGPRPARDRLRRAHGRQRQHDEGGQGGHHLSRP